MSDSESKCSERFQNYKKLMKADPKELYLYWDEIVKKLRGSDYHHKFHGIDLLARLASVDRDNRFPEIIDYYIGLLDSDKFTLSMHVAQNLGKIAKAKPALRPKITKALLSTKNTKHKHPSLLMSGAVISFMEYYEEVKNKKLIIKFVKNLVNSDSPKARKKAQEFLSKYSL